MDAANAPPSLAPFPSESTTDREAKENSDELHLDTVIKETSEHIERLDVVVDRDLSLRFSELPRERLFMRSCKAFPLMPRKSDATDYFFTPRVVSIGPYHHGKSCLAKMESHKSRFVKDFLSRDSSRSFEQYQHELKEILERRTNSDEYDATKFDLTRDEFVDIIILDGCFILEFLIKIYNHTPDEIFKDEALLRYIVVDLLMFENQVPLFVLHMLRGDRQNYKGPIPTIEELLAYYFWGKKHDPWIYESYMSPRSLLQLYNQLFILPRSDDGKLKYEYPRGNYWEIYDGNPISMGNSAMKTYGPSAQQLEKAGAIFRAKKSANFLDITFHEGVLEIPVLSMDEQFLLFFVNLAAFDLHVGFRCVMESYCRVMACLLETSTDVAILRKHGIIESKFMTDQNWHDLFDRFGKFDDIMTGQNYFASLFEDLWYFCARPEEKPYNGLRCFIACIKDCTDRSRNLFLLLAMLFLPAILIFAIAVAFILYFN
ncbi:hypothetical protein LUZ62_059749 [Rhynchospora pubera]|uniref:Uncharacterized protein n=1 Tax=Rhynchospora pubera TaxID=906938 RepID=A0AAV8E319_9POAL|nr:hypothetical protein LUZ62_059749 [Rhynchospora pubera]